MLLSYVDTCLSYINMTLRRNVYCILISNSANKVGEVVNGSRLCVCQQDYCKNSQPISLKLGIVIGP